MNSLLSFPHLITIDVTGLECTNLQEQETLEEKSLTVPLILLQIFSREFFSGLQSQMKAIFNHRKITTPLHMVDIVGTT